MRNVRNDKLRNVTCHSLRSSVVLLSPLFFCFFSSFLFYFWLFRPDRASQLPVSLPHSLVACADFLPGLFRFIFRGTSNDVLVRAVCLTRLVSPLPDTYSLAHSLRHSDSLSLSPFRRCRLCSRDLSREGFLPINLRERETKQIGHANVIVHLRESLFD